MRRPSSRIREEIERLQEQLKLAETKEAERIGRLALKSGLCDVRMNDADLSAAFEELAKRFQPEEKGTARERTPGAQADHPDA